jgi:uncharacterized protein
MDKRVEFGDGLSGIISGAQNSRGCVIITHGAGSGMDSSLLVQTTVDLVKKKFTVLRFNFAYLGKRPAPSAGGRVEQLELVCAIEFMKSQFGAPALIGKSFGARVNSFVCAKRADASALVFYGLPLQGASKSAKPRDWSHMSLLQCPMLFITGDKDKLCPLDELETIQQHLKAPFTSSIVKGDHSFKPKSEKDAVKLCVEWLDSLYATKETAPVR